MNSERAHTNAWEAGLLAVALFWLPQARSEDPAVKTFKPVVARAEVFFVKPRVLYDVQSFPSSPTGRVVLAHRFRADPIRYDVRKTDSLVTPIVGVITFNLAHESTDQCGSVKSSIGSFAESIEEAQALVEQGKCWEPKVPEVCPVSLKYSYSESRWKLEELSLGGPPKCEMLFDYAGGLPSSDAFQPTELNSPWRLLISGFMTAAP